MVQGAPGTGNHPDWEEPVAADWFYHILGEPITTRSVKYY